MSRARDLRRAEYELVVAARRNSPAHRALRRRAAARQAPDASPSVVDVSPEPVVAVDDAPTVVMEPVVEHEHEPEPELEPARHDEPTPTQAFASAMGASTQRPRRRWLRWVAAVAAVAGAYVIAAVLLRDTIPEGTTIEGVPAGDTVAEATAVVNGLAKVADAAPVTLTAGDNTTQLDPASAGLSVDVDGTVAGAGGFSLEPATLWHRLTGAGVDHELAVTVDELALTDAIGAAAEELDSNRADASVTIEGTSATATPGSQAVTVDRIAAEQEVLAAWPTTEPIALTAEVGDPDITTSEAKALAATLTAHVFAGPTRLTSPNGDVILSAARVADASAVVPVDGALVWQVDGEDLAQTILTNYPKIENAPVDASYKFTQAHTLKVTEGVPGRELDTASVDEAVIAAGGTASRTAAVPYIETEPDITAEELPTQDFTKRVSQFRTPLTAEPIRTRNLVRAAQLVTGTIVKAGDRFDLTDTIGPITAANGYYDAHVIVNGILTTGIGGGLSQMATTTYNAGYFAGYDDIEHRPHSVWFPRYPAGRESTVLNGSINVVFENTTPYAMIMNSYVEDGYLYVDIWSTPYYTVKTWASEKTNFTQPRIVDNPAENCEAKPNGQPGFTITNTRWVYLVDELVEKRSWKWTYRPDNGIRCTGPES